MIENNKEVLEQRMQNLEQELVDLALEDAMREASVSDYSFSDELYDIFSAHIEDRQTINEFFDDLARGGCASGIVGEMIYYSDTEDFYKKHLVDIDDFIDELENELGHINLDSPRYNSASWLVCEECGYRVSAVIDDSLNNILFDQLEDLNVQELDYLARFATKEEFRDAASEKLLELDFEELSLEDLEYLCQNSDSDTVREYALDAFEVKKEDQEDLKSSIRSDEIQKVSNSSIIDEARETLGTEWQESLVYRDEEEVSQSKGMKL